MNLKKTSLNSSQKDILEELSGVKIYLRNSFEKNQEQITDLLQIGKQNAFIYLQRNRLGQKLSIFEENNLFSTIVELQKKLNLKKLPRRIECYDISHLQGKFVYGSMVVFVDGRPAKKFYRLFKCPDKNDDYQNHSEVLARRIKRYLTWNQEQADKKSLSQNNLETLEKNLPKNLGNHLIGDLEENQENPWKLPDLMVIDGGKGQLSSDFKVLEEYGLAEKVEICALAKRVEEIFLPSQKESILLQDSTKFLVQRIRDEAHRFGITNNRKARLKTISKSDLDNISGIGPKTKQKLLQTFGSISEIADSLYKNPELVDELVGEKITEKLKLYFLGNLAKLNQPKT